MRSALLAAAGVGPFFRLELFDRPLPPDWQPAQHLIRAGLAEPAASTAKRLGTREMRVAASILHLGIAARLWSPVLGCALLAGVVPDLTSLAVSTKPSIRLGLAGPAGWRGGSPTDLAGPAGWRGGSPTDLAELIRRVVAGPLAGFASALPVRLANGLLRGNSASAMAGALGEVVRARPDLGTAAATLAAVLMRTPDLAGGGGLAGSGLAFRRRSCCLYYRVPGAVLCGDCCFDRPPTAGG